jgi:hypothetical protein
VGRPARWLLVLCLLIPLAPIRAQEAGKLQRVREEVAGDAPRETVETTTNDEDNLFGCFVSALVTDLFANDIESSEEPPRPLRYFPNHPYPGGLTGFMRFPRPPAPGAELTREDRVWLKPWSARFSVENGNDFDGLNRLGFRFLAEGSSGWGVQANGDWYHEHVRWGYGHDMGLIDLNVVYRLAEGKRALWRAGVGVRFLADEYAGASGVNFTCGGDFFPKKPWVASWQIDAGTLGQAGVFRGRGTVGVTLRGWEVFAGYDFLRIGFVNLQGPLLGLRVWF